MSLGIAFKGAEGIVLAADSRVTLPAVIDLPGAPAGQPQKALLPATFDNATKMLHIGCQTHIGAVTFGTGAIGGAQPRTAVSFMPEFEDEILHSNPKQFGPVRLSVEQFAKKLGSFFLAQWTKAKMPNPAPAHEVMIFFVGGYDEGDAYGKVFQVEVPNKPDPIEVAPGIFGATWGGQRTFVDRLMGFDPEIIKHIYDSLQIPAAQQNAPALAQDLKNKLALPIPWQFLPLQDCIDFCIFFIRTTIELQRLLVTLRGVGGEIDIATITRADGFRAVQLKQLRGETVFAQRS